MDQTQLEHFSIGSQGLEVVARAEWVAGFAARMAAFFKDRGGSNFVEVEVLTDDLGPLTLTLQRRNGLTPAQLRNQAEERLQQLQETVQAYLLAPTNESLWALVRTLEATKS